MSLYQILNQGEEQLYEFIYKASTLFPYSNDLMHVGLLGVLPFLIGKYGCERLADWCENLEQPEIAVVWREHANSVGLACSVGAEILWSCVIEPRSRYDHPGDLAGKLKGVGESLAGAGVAVGGSRLRRYWVERRLRRKQNKKIVSLM